MALMATKNGPNLPIPLGLRLPDPNETMSADEVRAFYAAQYPALATAIVNSTEAVGDKTRYILDRSIGHKG